MAFGEKLIAEVTTPYANYRIVDGRYNGRPARVLFGAGASPQSGMALDDGPELLFDYIQRFLEIAESLRPESILLIGGGAFTLPKALLEHFPDARVDVVEIDPELPQLARDYFSLPIDDHLHIYTEDGRHFLERTDTKYDLIILDAFAGFAIPAQLLTLEAAEKYHDHLTDGGILTANFISGYERYHMSLAQQLVATFGAVFPVVEIYRAGREVPINIEQNLLLVTGNKKPSLDYLQAGEEHLWQPLDDATLRDIY